MARKANETFVCVRCQVERSRDEYYFSSNLKRDRVCKECRRAASRETDRRKARKKTLTKMISEKKMLATDRPRVNGSLRCKNCEYMQSCQQRVQRGMHLLCEIPDYGDLLRTARAPEEMEAISRVFDERAEKALAGLD